MGRILYENKKTDSFIQLTHHNSEDYLEYYKHNVFYSGIYPNAPLKISFYLIATVLSMVRKSCNILILGTGLGGAAIQFKELLPDCRITTVDIEDVADLANEYFGLKKYPDIRFVNADAIQFVNSNQEKYDYILIDIFDEDRIPQGVISTRFFSDIHALLNRGGVLAFNTNIREIKLFRQYSPTLNPISYLHKQLYGVGFKTVMQNDFHHGGWMLGFKEKLDIREFKYILYDHYQAERNPYTKMSLAVSIIYLSEINISSLQLSHELTSKSGFDIISEYRKYVFTILISLLRRQSNMDLENPLLKRLCTLELQNLANKIKHGEVLQTNSGKKLFTCADEEYYKGISFLDESFYQISEIIPYLMLPDDLDMSIFKERHNSNIVNFVYIFGSYLKNEVVDTQGMDTILKREMGHVNGGSAY